MTKAGGLDPPRSVAHSRWIRENERFSGPPGSVDCRAEYIIYSPALHVALLFSFPIQGYSEVKESLNHRDIMVYNYSHLKKLVMM